MVYFSATCCRRRDVDNNTFQNKRRHNSQLKTVKTIIVGSCVRVLCNIKFIILQYYANELSWAMIYCVLCVWNSDHQ